MAGTGRREAVKAVTGREGIDQGPETHVCADGEGRVELRIVLGRAGVWSTWSASAVFFGNWRAPLGGDLEDVGPISFLPMGGVRGWRHSYGDGSSEGRAGRKLLLLLLLLLMLLRSEP